MNTKLFFRLLLLVLAINFTACEKDDVVDDKDDEYVPEEGEIVEDLDIDNLYVITGEQIWGEGITVNMNHHVIIEKGASLKIKPGVKVIANVDVAPEFYVKGDLLALGSEEKRIVMTVADVNRTNDNVFKGLWSGICATEESENFVLNYVTVEFCGAIGSAEHPSVQGGYNEDGEPCKGIFTHNITGKNVIHNSEFLYFSDDAFYSKGAQVSLYNNFFAYVGETGGECINIKSGVKGDVCFNTFYHNATNGIKWSNSGEREVQADVRVYNNTILNGGWRRSKSGRGGSLNIEKGARGASFNNLVVNCKYGFRVVGDQDTGETDVDMENTTWGNTYYYGNNQAMINEFVPSNGVLNAFEDSDIHNTDVAAGMPMFANYDSKANFSIENADTEFPTPVESIVVDSFRKYDFSLKSGSPAVGAGSTSVSPMYANITIDGNEFITPSSASYIGAKAVK